MDDLTEKLADLIYKIRTRGRQQSNTKPLGENHVGYDVDCARELLALMPFKEIRELAWHSASFNLYEGDNEMCHLRNQLISASKRFQKIKSLLPAPEPQPDKRQQLIDKLTAIRKRIEDSGQPLLSMDEIIERLRGGE